MDARELKGDEATAVWLRVLEKWGADGYEYWLPLAGDPPGEDVEIFWVLDPAAAAEALRSGAAALGVERVYELSEGGPSVSTSDPARREREISTSLWDPTYDGLERYSVPPGLEWLVYASHEGTLAIAGNDLIEAVGAHPSLRSYESWSERDVGGFLIAPLPGEAVGIYESGRGEKIAERLRGLRSALTNVNHLAYRGIGRYPLAPYWTEDVSALERDDQDTETDHAARMLLTRTPERPADSGSLIRDLGKARDVLTSVDVPSRWELIWAGPSGSVGGELMGFDIGWWPASYSILSDSAVFPTWHGPPEHAYGELNASLEHLNENTLFDSAEAAKEFRTRYRRWAWSESEEGIDRFLPLRVELVPRGRRL